MIYSFTDVLLRISTIMFVSDFGLVPFLSHDAHCQVLGPRDWPQMCWEMFPISLFSEKLCVRLMLIFHEPVNRIQF